MILVIGGGPAGFFGAIAARESRPDLPVVLLEKQGRLLRKVAISGGGRCNVTHACFDAREFSGFYPRGGRELIGPLTRWGAQDTVDWFAERGVELKTEADGRMFPVTDDSGTIVECLRGAAREMGVEVRTRRAVTALERSGDGLSATLDDGSRLSTLCTLLATGGNEAGGGHELARSLGHTIQPLVPSLFTFHVPDPAWHELAGVVVDPVIVRAIGSELPARSLTERGPLLLTHWGVSGPGVLKLSARGARDFHAVDYRFELGVDWLPDRSREALDTVLLEWAEAHPRKSVFGARPDAGDLPRRLWEELARRAGIPAECRWAELGKKPRRRLTGLLKDTRMSVDGKSTNKDEFVTCGGVSLREVDLKTMSSRICPGLYLAGEVLDIDGITGGFNFQAAWTTGRLAGQGMAQAIIEGDMPGDSPITI